MSQLFSPLTIRRETMRNRLFVAPMCLYSAVDGVANDWHLVHLGCRAIGGAGLVMAEATAVCPEGRISPADTGLWNDQQAAAFQKIAGFIRANGATPAIQLAHAGRKASTDADWRGGGRLLPGQGGWEPVGPSAVPFKSGEPAPVALEAEDLPRISRAFADAAQRSVEAGFGVVELHMAHGYLLHQFLSPLSNHRLDAYGGGFEGRIRFPLMVVRDVRRRLPDGVPLFVRISATDWVAGGWDLEQSVAFSRRLGVEGVDLIDCSTGGAVPKAEIPMAPGFQVPFAAQIRRDTGLMTAAVGLITRADHAEAIVAEGEADAVFLARELLRSPQWPLFAAQELGADAPWPRQYARAKPPVADVARQVVVTATTRVQPERRGAFLALARRLMVATRREPGNLSYEVAAAADAPATFLFHERWVSEAAIEVHLATPHMREFLAASPLLLAEPEVAIRRYDPVALVASQRV